MMEYDWGSSIWYYGSMSSEVLSLILGDSGNTSRGNIMIESLDEEEESKM